MVFRNTSVVTICLITCAAIFGVVARVESNDKTQELSVLEEYYGDDTVSPLLEPEKLRAMLADPGIAPRIIILDANANNDATITIPTSNTGAKVIFAGTWPRMIRNEGAMTVNYAIADGLTADALLQSWGVKKDSILIMTSNWTAGGANSNSIGNWWLLHYWGFSKKNLMVLNGGTGAYRALVGTANMGHRTNSKDIVASTFSVRELPGDRIGDSPRSLGSARTNIRELMAGVKNDDYISGRKIILSTLINAMFTPFEDERGNPVTINAYGHGFMGRIKGQKFMQAVNTTDNYVTDSWTVPDPAPTAAGTNITYYKYKKFEDMRNVFVDRDQPGRIPLFPDNKAVRISLHCGTGTTTMPFYFALTMAGYYNAAPYDGSGAEWFTMAAYTMKGNNAVVSGTEQPKAAPPYLGDLVIPPPPYAARNSLGMMANRMLEIPAEFLRYNESRHTYSRFDNKSKYIGELEITPENLFVEGPYKGIMKWDMTRYSDYIVMLYNANPVAYSSASYEYHANYEGSGNEIQETDLHYKYPTLNLKNGD